MTAVIQRVSGASVSVDGECVGRCGRGLLILLGVARGDTRDDADALARKIKNLRVFTDENGKMNLSLTDVRGEVLVVSNFTLLASYRHGNRPDYMNAASPDEAKELYGYFKERIADGAAHVGSGVFGAHMEVSMTGDGPVTLVLESSVLLKKIL